MKKILNIFFTAVLIGGCDFLDPLPTGNVTDENIDNHPSYIRGYVDKAYSLLPTTYINNEHIYLDAITDDAVITSSSNAMRRYGLGAVSMGNYPFETYWTRDYSAIMYVNKFLDGNIGLNTRYLVDSEANALLQKYLQGDAYALRAWFEFDLLKKFGGVGTDGRLLGVPITTSPVDVFETDPESVVRNTYDECVMQILADCDSALHYLPEANRDWLGEHSTIDGASRWQRMDGLTVKALMATVYLFWASPAFNPTGDASRWDKAAQYAAEVMRFKLEQDGANGFDPSAKFTWLWPNSSEIIWTSKWATGSTYENLFYPQGFRGNGTVGATQNLVDAFPMANGYPIDAEESGYDPANPYHNRDPRFYSTINYNGASAIRTTNGEVMYTFDMSTGGKDAAGGVGNTLTNYYVKKYVNPGWNKNDSSVDTQPHSIYFFRWTHMCLVFAEAANQTIGPETELYGYTAKQALAYLRNRTTTDGMAGLGVNGDKYLDEVATSGKEAFDALVHNERHIELCFEGQRFYDLRRWSDSSDWTKELNVAVKRPVFDGSSISYETIETRAFSSKWLPIPYYDAAKTGMVQNEGWNSWK